MGEKKKMAEEEKRNEMLRKDNLDLNLDLTAKLSDLRNLTEETERQSSELSRVNEENNRLNDTLNQTEVSLRDCQLKLQDKTDEVLRVLDIYFVKPIFKLIRVLF